MSSPLSVAMRAALFALLLIVAPAVAAQPTDLDRRIATLSDEIARVEADLATVRADLARLRADERDLDAERLTFQDAIRAYQADADALQQEADRVRRLYDDLARYGGSRLERMAYDDARLRLADAADRLDGEARMLDDWTDDLSARYRDHADRIHEVAGAGQRLSERRSALGHEHETLAARRDRLMARGR